MKDNLKVSFLQSSEIAAKQIANGTIVGGHLGVMQGYLVYTFFVLNPQNQTGHLTIVDAGNGKVLYTSHGVSRGSFGQSPGFGPFGTFGPLVGHGFGGGFGMDHLDPGVSMGLVTAWAAIEVRQHE
jgi:hypothetical protein